MHPLASLLALLPPRWVVRLGALAGWIWYHALPPGRRSAREALARFFPEKPGGEREAILRRSFQHRAISALERAALPACRSEALLARVRLEGYVPIDGAKAGRVLVTGASGNPSLVVAAVKAREPDRQWVEGPAPARLLAGKLGKGLHLQYPFDRDMPRGRGYFVPFLGRLASTPIGFSLLARKVGGSCVSSWCERLPDGTHTGHLRDVALDDHPNLRIALLNDAFAVSRRMEEAIRSRPEQWPWTMPRWETQPREGDLVRSDRGLEVVGEGRAGAILDRDGTINLELGHGLLDPSEVTLAPQAAEGIRRLNRAGVPVIVATNQANIARGLLDPARLDAIHARVGELLGAHGAKVDAWYVCPHHPTEGSGHLTGECDCRKPKPGLIRKALSEWRIAPALCLFVGDRAGDVAAARGAGLKATVVTNGWAKSSPEPVEADETVPDLVAAADRFLEGLSGRLP